MTADESEAVSAPEGTQAPPNPPSEADDISNAWGFHILQAIRGFEDRVAARFDAQDAKFEVRFASLDATIDALDTKLETKIDALDTKFETKIDALDTKFDRKFDSTTTRIDTLGSDLRREISGLRYWTWGAILPVLIASATLILQNPHL